MRGFPQMVWINLKLYLREPIAAFTTLAFPPLLVVIFGAMYGNQPTPMFGGFGSMDVTMPAYTGLILASVGFLGVPIIISGYRESGVLRRFRATPMQPLTYILADVVTNLFMVLLGMVALVAVGWLLYRVRFEGEVFAVLAAVILSGLALFAVGYVIGSLAPSVRTALVIGMVVFYPMTFLSGAAIPLEVLPETIQRVAQFLPLTYAVRLLRGLWLGGAWSDYLLEAVVLGGVLAVSALLAARLFRWE